MTEGSEMTQYFHGASEIRLTEDAIINDAYLFHSAIGEGFADVDINIEWVNDVEGVEGLTHYLIKQKVTMTYAQAITLRDTLNIALAQSIPAQGDCTWVISNGRMKTLHSV